MAISLPVKSKPNFISFNALAPKHNRIDKKMSIHTTTRSSKNYCPKIVTPEREVPGITTEPERYRLKGLFYKTVH